MDEIVNKVANSKLIVFDLEDYYPDDHVMVLDISQWLFGGFILKEAEFREQLKTQIGLCTKINTWLCIVPKMRFYQLGLTH